MSANQPTAAWSGPGDPLVVVAGHLVSPQDNFGEIGRMPNGNLRRPNRMNVGAGGIFALSSLELTGFGNRAFFDMRRANGTEQAPTAIANGNVIGRFNFRGFDGVGFNSGARIRASAAENWAVGAQGTNFEFFTTSIGSAALSSRWQMQAPGHLVATTDNVLDIGASGANRPRDLFLGRNIVIGGALNHDGTTMGVYGTAPIAQQVGVAVTSAGIHAACVALGLFTA